MSEAKVVLLVEARVKPERRGEIVSAASASLQLTLAEPGVEAFYQTARQDDPNVLVFFEVFSSEDAHNLHLQEEYTRKIFQLMEDGLAEPPRMSRLVQLQRSSEGDYQ